MLFQSNNRGVRLFAVLSRGEVRAAPQEERVWKWLEAVGRVTPRQGNSMNEDVVLAGVTKEENSVHYSSSWTRPPLSYYGDKKKDGH